MVSRINGLWVNVNGLTYARWYSAAMFGVPRGRRPVWTEPALMNAWKAGECPAEWAAQ